MGFGFFSRCQNVCIAQKGNWCEHDPKATSQLKVQLFPSPPLDGKPPEDFPSLFTTIALDAQEHRLPKPMSEQILRRDTSVENEETMEVREFKAREKERHRELILQQDAEAARLASIAARQERQEALQRERDMARQFEEDQAAERASRMIKEENVKQVEKNRVKINVFLKQNGFNGLNEKRGLFWSYEYPLHVGVAERDVEMVMMMLKADADRHLKNSAGQTAQDLAIKHAGRKNGVNSKRCTSDDDMLEVFKSFTAS